MFNNCYLLNDRIRGFIRPRTPFYLFCLLFDQLYRKIEQETLQIKIHSRALRGLAPSPTRHAGNYIFL